jgi:type IV pilus assembly protein PilV
MRLKTTSSTHQRGLTLIESLVALVVAALGILGIAGVQMRTLVETQNSVRREQAVRLIEDLDERLKAHPNALEMLTSYISDWSSGTPDCDTPPTPNCRTATCTADQLVDFDVASWVQAVQCTLPNGNANIFRAPGDQFNNPRQLGVMIRWRANERQLVASDTTYLTNIDATQASAGGGGAGSTVTCNPAASPNTFTCHLQYIAVAARCAPYFPGSNPDPLYFCP